MADEGLIVLEGLVRKLQSLRATLSETEAAFLDQMVENATPEVVIHGMHPGAAVVDESEVAMHALTADAGGGALSPKSTIKPRIHWDGQADAYVIDTLKD